MTKTTSEQNKAIVLEAIETLFNKRDYAAAERFWSPAYIQHSAPLAPRREGIFEFVKAAPTLHYENALIVADGDYVMLHSRISGIGQPVNWVVVDILRIENGLIAEHWDVIQDEATRESSKSGLPMFGANFPPDDRSQSLGLEVHTTTIAVEHVTVPSQKSFESVKTELESLVPRIDDGVFALLRDGEAERAHRELEQAPGLSIFGFRDHGGLLKIYGLQRKAIQYDIGNPLTASRMTQHQLSAALYAPIRVLLRDSVEGGVAFEYDRPVSVFGQFNNADVNAVAQELDRHLQAALQKAAA